MPLRYLLIAAALIIILPPVPARAWSWPGHKIVAQIAEYHLTQKSRALVDRLLATEGKSNMHEVASWADAVRVFPFTRYPNHTVRLPLDDSEYSPERDCPRRRCAIAGIEEAIKVLSKHDLNDEVQMVALKVLIHLVGDIHQPLHASADNGERPAFTGEPSVSLHYVWDRLLVSCRHKGWVALAKEIDAWPTSVVADSPPIAWAMEGRNIARDHIFPKAERYRAENVRLMPPEYCEEEWPLVKAQLKAAGVRLAAVLNKLSARP